MHSQTNTQPVCPAFHNGLSAFTGATPTDTDTAYVDTHPDPAAGMEIVLRSYIRMMFKDAAYVRHNQRTLAFLKDPDVTILIPHRIAAFPSAVLEVVVDGPLGLSGVLTTPPSATPKLKGDKKDFLKASECNLKAVKKGHAYAQFAVGKLYFDGKDATQDYNKSMAWYLKSANQGLPDGQVEVCDLCYYDRGVPKDYSVSLEWALKAADQGFLAGIRSVGIYYHPGATLDYSLAMQYYLKAAKLGDADAQVGIGQLYRDSLGVQQNYSRAMEWFLEASQQGYVIAYTHIGGMYEKGEGVRESYSTVMRWYLKAVDRGYAPA
ncbi:hypothetical protein BGW39_000732 [Mortierella sp. 14UC]|nr:hypothetical protein BGW39_000732 [Mortierella sp. 14UC]